MVLGIILITNISFVSQILKLQSGAILYKTCTPETDPKIAELEGRLESLVRTQIDFQVEVTAIRNELTRLRNAPGSGGPVTTNRPPIQQRREERAPEQPLPPRVTAASGSQPKVTQNEN